MYSLLLVWLTYYGKQKTCSLNINPIIVSQFLELLFSVYVLGMELNCSAGLHVGMIL